MADKKQFKPVWWWILGVVLFCALCWLIWCPSGLDRKDAITSCIALGGVLAVVVGIFQTNRRITQQEDQFNAQIKKQNEQIRIQHQQLLDTRFASGVELLGNPHESTRIGGAYNLYFLARDNKEYIKTVCEILCAHIRTITSDTNYQEKYKDKPSNEIDSIIYLLFHKREFNVSKEEIHGSIFMDKSKFLSKSYLCGANFMTTKLDSVHLMSAKLNYAHFTLAELQGVRFGAAELKNSFFDHSKLNDVDFIGAQLDSADFHDVKEMRKVDFSVAKLENANFQSAKMTEVDFRGAVFNDKTNFTGTRLADHSYEEIAREGRSLELTKPEEENPQ